MKTKPGFRRLLPMVYTTSLLLLVATFVIGDTLEEGGAGGVADRPTRFVFFNMEPDRSYDVSKNALPLATLTTSPQGRLAFNETVTGGDRLMIANGLTQGPMPPQQVSATESGPGTVTVTWRANTEPNIKGYVVYHGGLSVAQGDASQYDDSLDTGDVNAAEIDNLAPGIHYFAVRAYDTLDLFSGYSAEKTAEVAGSDETAPLISDASPTDGEQNVSKNTKLYFVLSDDQTGVDITALDVKINGASPKKITFEGNPARYQVKCQVPGLLQANSANMVELSVTDRASPSNAFSTAWSFVTGDTSDTGPPGLCCEKPRHGRKNCCPSPSPNAVNVDRLSDVTIGVHDEGTGIDLSSMTLLVNDAPAPFAYDGDLEDGMILFENTEGFKPGGTVHVSFSVCDLSSPENCSTLDYTFEVAEGLGTTAAAEGAILPDGYWVDNPSRPLEIQNLPSGWTVRIFDTSGIQIRRHDNDTGSSIDWHWDFTNAQGRHVARGLYLVRVMDEGNGLRQAGKFLVQSD